jgi:hypothetical protein
MSKYNDGGPAFPCAIETGEQREFVDVETRTVSVMPEFKHLSGMTLRDYMAAAALAGSDWSNWVERHLLDADLADNCYAKADAMLAARAKGGAS